MILNYEIILRLILSAIIGGLIGMEREVSNRPAGLRTHVLVTLGSTLIMLVSIDGFFFQGVRIGDPSRLAAQVVSGIGFLGAGTIMKTGDRIQGLTTAASLWVSAGVGLAVGSGYYLGAIVTSVIVLGTLMSLKLFEKRIESRRYKPISIIVLSRPGIIGQIGVVFGNHNVSIKDINIIGGKNYKNNDEEDEYGTLEIFFLVKCPNDLNQMDFYKDVYEIHGMVELVFDGKTIPNI